MDKQLMHGWATACVAMMDATHHGRCKCEECATLAVDTIMEQIAINGDTEVFSTETPQMKLSPKVRQRIADDERDRLLRKQYLERYREELWTAEGLTGWMVSEIPKECAVLPKEGVRPMQPYYEVRCNGEILYTSTDYFKTAERFYRLATLCKFQGDDVEFVGEHLGLREPLQA